MFKLGAHIAILVVNRKIDPRVKLYGVLLEFFQSEIIGVLGLERVLRIAIVIEHLHVLLEVDGVWGTFSAT